MHIHQQGDRVLTPDGWGTVVESDSYVVTVELEPGQYEGQQTRPLALQPYQAVAVSQHMLITLVEHGGACLATARMATTDGVLHALDHTVPSNGEYRIAMLHNVQGVSWAQNTPFGLAIEGRYLFIRCDLTAVTPLGNVPFRDGALMGSRKIFPTWSPEIVLTPGQTIEDWVAQYHASIRQGSGGIWYAAVLERRTQNDWSGRVVWDAVQIVPYGHWIDMSRVWPRAVVSSES